MCVALWQALGPFARFLAQVVADIRYCHLWKSPRFVVLRVFNAVEILEGRSVVVCLCFASLFFARYIITYVCLPFVSTSPLYT